MHKVEVNFKIGSKVIDEQTGDVGVVLGYQIEESSTEYLVEFGDSEEAYKKYYDEEDLFWRKF